MRHRFHAICPYFAMFPELFVQKHLVWSRPGDLVFDPFSGRGTTVFESLLNGRRAAACDTNPVAYCVSMAKSCPPTLPRILERLKSLSDAFETFSDDWDGGEFFRLCFEESTLRQILFLRKELKWKTDHTDCFIAALSLGCLHGESHRSGRYFSNRMPRTISTKPDYSVRWWNKNNYLPPKRDVFEILKHEAAYRFESEPASIQGEVIHGDARNASTLFIQHQGEVSLVITSPPYLDTTNFLEDQWLRVWFLGGDPRPVTNRDGDDRHTKPADYWSFLQEAWEGLRGLLKPEARIIIRMGGTKLTFDETEAGLTSSLEQGLASPLQLVEKRVSAISGGQLRSFRPNAEGTKVEYDFHYQLRSA